MSDISVKFGYVDLVDDDGSIKKEPAMGIRQAVLGKTPIFAIPLESAWKYAEPEYLMAASFKIAEFLGMFPDAFLINRIADTILNHIPDLIKQRPFTAAEGKENGEGKIMFHGEVEHFGVTTTGGILK